ncbi:MAG: hypothetical protein ACJ77K_17705 [Bacteroidia bacterium]
MEDKFFCKISGEYPLPADYHDDKVGKNHIYTVRINEHLVEIRFCKTCYEKKDIEENKELILSLLINNKVYRTGEEILHWNCKSAKNGDPDKIDLPTILESTNYPRTPEDKINYLFNKLYLFQKYDGELILTMNNFFTRYRALSWYFKNLDEMRYYARALAAKDDIEIQYNPEAETISRYRITYQGLINYINLFEKGLSKNCFVAMAFDDTKPELKTIRQKIIEAIVETGFNPVIVDQQHINSDKTVVDEIITLIKSCKFCIADFTYHRGGVYFESGFAAGQGKPVIYTCHSDHFDNSHFDTKGLQHLIYKDSEQLKTALKNKISAWII